MKYTIEVDDIEQASAYTSDVAMFIARAIQSHWDSLNDSRDIKVYKDGKLMYHLSKHYEDEYE